MEWKEAIYYRKSVRTYTDNPVEEAIVRQIRTFCTGLKPLYPAIKTRVEVISPENVRSVLTWLPPQLLAFYTEETEGALENVGFLYQQLELWLQSQGIGTCWIGMGKPNPQSGAELKDDGLRFAILMAFGHPKEPPRRKDVAEFKRKTLEEISDQADSRLEPARLAPSSVNSQPWYFVHDKDTIHAYCETPGLLARKALARFNRVDMGIALAHLYVENPNSFRFFRVDDPPQIKGRYYTGSFTL